MKDTQTSTSEKAALTVVEVAEMLGVSVRTVFTLATTPGFPPSVRISPGGRSRRWIRSEVLSWLERKATRDTPPRRTVSKNS